MNDSNFLKEIGRSYLVSAFLPAAIFTLLGFFLFRGFIPKAIADQLLSSESFANYQWIILSLLVFWVAFYLFSATDITVRIFEGYSLPKPIQEFFIKRQKKNWEKRNLAEYKKWERLDHSIQKKIKNGRAVTERQLNQLPVHFLKAHEELAHLGIRSPLDEKDLMPTRLGNVLRASEMYAYERYAIEEVTIWPRLVGVLPPEMINHIEEKNNYFMFLLNSAFLVYVNAIFCFVFGVLGLPVLFSGNFLKPLLAWANGFFYIGYDFIPPYAFLAFSTVLGLFGHILYLIAVNAAEDYGMYIMASFDLYRANLIRQLNWPQPKTLCEERDFWRNVTRFIISAERLGEMDLLQTEYANLPMPEKKPASPNKRNKRRTPH